MRRILLIGRNGQLGWELNRTLSTLGELTVLDYPELDLTKSSEVSELVRRLEPQVIVNAAAYTNVDGAEAEQARARAINAEAPGLLAGEARRLGALLVHYSTDYVFDGSKGAPYTETDNPNPLNFYGKSKLEGEDAVLKSGAAAFVLRTSAVYSLRQAGGFVQKVLQWAHRNPILRIVEDQVVSPTWARVLAEVTAQLLSRDDSSLRAHAGLYHLGGAGSASRLEWARLILELDPNRQNQVAKEVQPAYTEEFPTPARRPLFSALDNTLFDQTFNLTLPSWQEALRLAMS